ncbi:MAG TPA: hypothetical protein VI423_11015, partial [Paenisporosarcina sp.]|nr:hypothetical protein [Paenisporosarcina sp.]
EVAASFASGATNLPAAFKKSGAYDEALLLDLVSHVEAIAGSAYVVGTKKALARVTAGANVALYSELMKNELASTGRVANFNGMTLVQLPAVHKANSFDFAYDDDQLLVLPANDDRFIKIVFEGDDMIKQTTEATENQDMSLEHKFLTRFGVKTVFSSLFGEYKFI